MNRDERGIAHIGLIVAAIAVVLIGVFIVKNSSFSVTKDGASVVETGDYSRDTERNTAEVLALTKKHFKDVHNGNIDSAYAVTCDYFREFTSKDDFSSMVSEGVFKAVDLSEVEYTDVSVANSQARLSGEIGPLLPDTILEIDLLVENGDWCLAGYRTK